MTARKGGVDSTRTQARLHLADRLSSLGTLAAGVAHEINNPLAYVVTSLELLVKRLPELGLDAEQLEWQRRHLERAQEGAERVRRIVRGLGALARADDETLGTVDPRRTLDTAVTLVSSEIRKRATLVVDYDGLPTVWANEGRLGQVFLNLLVNAAQAIPAGAAETNEIRISGHTDAEGRAVIEVRDTGVGIDAQHLSKVFDPFFTTKPVNEGTGLGLSICHAIVSAFDGQITADSALGAGSTFRIVLPGKPGPVLMPAPPTLPRAMAKRGRMLFIDDEEDICAGMEDAIAPHHDIVTTTHAQEALRILASGQHFDVILCDIRMPEMTGTAFHDKLALAYPAQAERLVLMSGGFKRRPGDPPLDLPRPLLEKPFEIKQVLALMTDALRHPQAIAS